MKNKTQDEVRALLNSAMINIVKSLDSLSGENQTEAKSGSPIKSIDLEQLRSLASKEGVLEAISAEIYREADTDIVFMACLSPYMTSSDLLIQRYVAADNAFENAEIEIAIEDMNGWEYDGGDDLTRVLFEESEDSPSIKRSLCVSFFPGSTAVKEVSLDGVSCKY